VTNITQVDQELWGLATPDQVEIDGIVLELLAHPEVQKARTAGLKRFSEHAQFRAEDGPATLAEAVDNLLFGALQAAANDDPARPKVIWTERLPYTSGGRRFPGCRYGADCPDRVYRSIGVTPEYRYEIKASRHPTHPSANDFSVEAVPPPALYNAATATTQVPHELDVDSDGVITVIADATPTNGRRNHVHMAPGTRNLFVRETLHDWPNQVPNHVTVRVVDGPEAPERSLDEIAKLAAGWFPTMVEGTIYYLDTMPSRPLPHEFIPFLRGAYWGVRGGSLAYNEFNLRDDEALIVTLDRMYGAQYLGLIVCDPWSLTMPYDERPATLNHNQVQANPDGTYTFVVSREDPGVCNWLDTYGLRSGILAGRWELFSSRPRVVDDEEAEEARRREIWAEKPFGTYGPNLIDGGVGEIRIVKLGEVAAALPAPQAHVSPQERQERNAERAESYLVRVNGQPITGSAR
jgi:hypothetical protein